MVDKFGKTSSLNTGNIFLLIEPNSISSIRAVPAIVLKPSGAKNITSPASSCILLPSIHPIFLVTAVTTKSLLDVPDILNILSSNDFFY